MKYLERLLLLGFVLVGAAGYCSAKREQDNLEYNKASLKRLAEKFDTIDLIKSDLSEIKIALGKLSRDETERKAEPKGAIKYIDTKTGPKDAVGDFDRALNIVGMDEKTKETNIKELSKKDSDLLKARLVYIKNVVHALSMSASWEEIATKWKEIATKLKKINMYAPFSVPEQTTPNAMFSGVNAISKAAGNFFGRLIRRANVEIAKAKINKDAATLVEAIDKTAKTGSKLDLPDLKFHQIEFNSLKHANSLIAIIADLEQLNNENATPEAAILEKIRDTLQLIGSAANWAAVSKAIEGKTVKNIKSKIIPEKTLDGIVKSWNQFIERLKQGVEKQINSDLAKNFVAAKAKKSATELVESIKKLVDQVNKITPTQIQTEVGSIAKNMEKFITLLGQASETAILKQLKGVLEAISKSQEGWEKLDKKVKQMTKTWEDDIISKEDLEEIVLAYNQLLLELAHPAKKADAKKRVEALIDAIHKLAGVIKLKQIKTESSLVAGKVKDFISSLGKTPEAKELENIETALKSIANLETWEKLESVWKKLESVINFKKKISAPRYITNDDFDKIMEAFYNLVETLYRRASLIGLEQKIRETFKEFDPSNNQTAYNWVRYISQLKTHTEATIEKIKVQSGQLKELVARLENISKARDANTLKELKIILMKTKIDPKSNPTEALDITINELIEIFNKSCREAQEHITGLKIKTALLLDVLAAGEKVRAAKANSKVTEAELNRAIEELKRAIKTLQTDPAAIETLKKYPEALLAATAKVVKEPKTAEEQINFEKMVTKFERYIQVLALINEETPILDSKILNELLAAGFRGREMLAKATAKSIEETKKTIDANLKKEAEKQDPSEIWRWTFGLFGY